MGGIIQNLGSSITGKLPKAMLYVRDPGMRAADGSAFLGDATGEDAGSLSWDLFSAAQKALKGEDLGGASNGRVLTYDDLQKGKVDVSTEGFIALEVQYNPASISMDAVAGRIVTNTGGTLSQIMQPASITMSFQLVFDDMNPSDAFMINSFSLTGDVTSKVANLAKRASGEFYSVQTQIDGLMSLLSSAETRQVVFFWSNMSFRGEVTNVRSQYTMFSPSGRPIRGVVELYIRQGSSSDGTEYNYKYEDKYWNEAFDRAFNAEGVAGETPDWQKFVQNNFLNLNI